MESEHPVISAFHKAAGDVPAYRRILQDAGVDPAEIRTLDDFRGRAPVIDKNMTFDRFSLAELCRGGRIGHLAGVVTSSGHSGRFAFGIYDAGRSDGEIHRNDDAMDAFFQVRSRTTLLINCLPMGVKLHTRECTLADVSVRADMATALVSKLGVYYDQIIFVGEAAFLKLVLELGLTQGIDWRGMLVHAIVGEEPLAENARKYLEGILGIEPDRLETGMIGSSMGAAELGLNLFFELPPLIALRRRLHEDAALRREVLGDECRNVPMLFTCDPGRTFVEVLDDGQLVVSTLDPHRPLPLIRYRTEDVASFLEVESLAAILPAAPENAVGLGDLPILMMQGRGDCARAGDVCVYPEQVKEGIYHDPELARLITANFRLRSGKDRAILRIQLSPGVAAEPDLAERFAKAISQYVHAPLDISCEPYETFSSGMALDYERKFDYLGE